MLGDLIAALIRVVVAAAVNLSRGQLLEGNGSSNLLALVQAIDGDAHINLAVLGFSRERLSASADRAAHTVRSSLAEAFLQLSSQGVGLALDQTGVINGVHNNSAVFNLRRTIREVRVGSNARATHGLTLVVDLLVLGDLVVIIRRAGIPALRVLLASAVNLRGGQLLEGNSSSDSLTLRRVADNNGHVLRTVRLSRNERLVARTEDSLTVCLINKVSGQGVHLARNQAFVGDSVNHGNAVLDFLSTVSEVRVCGDLRVTDRLVLIVDFLVLGNLIAVLVRVVVTASVDDLGGQFLESNSRGHRAAFRSIVDSDLHVLGAVRFLRREGLRAPTQDSLAVSLIDQLRGEGVLLVRHKTGVGDGIHDHSAVGHLSGTLREVCVRRDVRNTNSLVRVVDVLVLSDLVVVRVDIRGLATLRVVPTSLVNLSRGQLFERNRSLNRPGHIVVDLDFNLNGTVSGLRGEGLRAGAHDGLAVSLVNQLRGQGVFLARNQTLVINSVDDGVASSNLSRAVRELRVGRNARLKHGADRLCLVVDVVVLSDIVDRLPVGLLTSLVDFLGSQTLKRNRSLNRVLGVGNSDLNLDVAVNQLALVAWDHEGHRTSTKDIVLVLFIDELRVQRVALTRNQAVVVHSVHNGVAVLHNVHAVLELRNGANFGVRVEPLLNSGSHCRRHQRDRRRSLLSLRGLRGRLLGSLRRLLAYDRLGIVLDVIVLSNVVDRFALGFLASCVDFLRSQVLKRNRSRNRLGDISVHLDFDLDRTRTRLRRSESSRALTQYAASPVRTGLTNTLHQLRGQGVLLARNQTLVINSVDHCVASNNLGRAICKLRIRLDARLKHGANGLRLIVDVVVLSDLVIVGRVLFRFSTLRVVLAVCVNLRRSQVLKRDRSWNRVHTLVDRDINVDFAVNEVALVAFGSKGHSTGTQDIVFVLLIDELCVQRVALTRDQVGVGHGIDNNRARLDLGSTVLELSLSLDRGHRLDPNRLVRIVEVRVFSDNLFRSVTRSCLPLRINGVGNKGLKHNRRLTGLYLRCARHFYC